ncbi:MAG: hypothetical protein CFE48_01810 [Pseudomonas sp. PGPPP2]|nr:MAG: hypothetical protein CFE48_01810 [Pseudomonas sp. PGPPP2]
MTLVAALPRYSFNRTLARSCPSTHAPKDFERNWVQTSSGKHGFSFLRLYAPTEANVDKS